MVSDLVDFLAVAAAALATYPSMAAAAALIGLIAGNFVNALAHRLPLMLEQGANREDGGEEKHTLTENEMPGHRHPLSASPDEKQDQHLAGSNSKFGLDQVYDSGGGHDQKKSVIGVTGKGESHNNMPPYIALYFCKYEGT